MKVTAAIDSCAAVLPDTLRQMNKPLPVQKDRALSLASLV